MRSRPRAPAAGSLSWLTPDCASATASAFSAPDARIQTSRAAWMALNVREIRVGGGLGEFRTATTEPVACAAGDSGKIEATWPSGPMPSMRMSKAGTAAPAPAALDNSAAYRAAAASGSSPSGPSGPGTACTRAGSTSSASSRAARAPVSFRSGSPVAANRSSPHQKSTRRQSTASLAGAAAIAARTFVPIPPPVSTRCACPSAAIASASLVTVRAAAALASRSPLA